MSGNIHLRAEKVIYTGFIDLLAITEDGHVGRPLVMEPHDDFTCISEPTLRLGTAEAQELMDDLWQAGLRPSEGTGSAGSLAATERHLKDMRTIAFKQLKIDEG